MPFALLRLKRKSRVIAWCNSKQGSRLTCTQRKRICTATSAMNISIRNNHLGISPVLHKALSFAVVLNTVASRNIRLYLCTAPRKASAKPCHTLECIKVIDTLIKATSEKAWSGHKIRKNLTCQMSWTGTWKRKTWPKDLQSTPNVTSTQPS